VVDQQRTDIRIVADAVSANPGIDERQRHNEQNCQPKNPLPPLRPSLPRHPGWRQAQTRDGFAPNLEDIRHGLIVWREIAPSQSANLPEVPESRKR
jgi:hypothetical protein